MTRYSLNGIGFGLIGFGIFFTFLAIILFFDRGLLALGNILWLTGVTLLLGLQSTWKLFTNRANYKGSICFLLGLFFLFVRWPIVGIILEIYGFIALFSGFWPSVKVFLYQIPVVGWIIQYPLMVISINNLFNFYVQDSAFFTLVFHCLKS
ncbi:Got1/Sft2-like vescicle transport protein family [Citrus sinensis]|uniref:Got1/Sft2-like vescicle transport protein family n=1 Tax=Citrus sinensis TaxID=2711 RepID=A0ACB8MDZ1_CITSI|nr:Got1/Sft2-like vescicle transport protein family [Citrus sinensis]